MKIRSCIAAVTFAAVSGLLFAAGCGGTDNVATCQAYVDKINTLDCLGGVKFTFDCSVYDQTDCDISDYFTCLTNDTKCTDGALDQSTAGECVSKATCN